MGSIKRFLGFPGGASGKRICLPIRENVRDAGSIPGSGRSPGRSLEKDAHQAAQGHVGKNQGPSREKRTGQSVAQTLENKLLIHVS